MFPSYRNQSVDLLSKSTDWFYVMGTLVVKGLIAVKLRLTGVFIVNFKHMSPFFLLYLLLTLNK